MNKADLVDKIAGACEMSKAQATMAIESRNSLLGPNSRKRSTRNRSNSREQNPEFVRDGRGLALPFLL